MFYLNNNNIEEMFREAAEKYRLPSDAAFDWERIERNLTDEKSKATALQQQKKRRKSFFIISCLLLIPLGWFANMWYNHTENKNAQKSFASQNNIQKSEQEKNSAKNNYTGSDNKQSQSFFKASAHTEKEDPLSIGEVLNQNIQSFNSILFPTEHIMLPNRKNNMKNNAATFNINKPKTIELQHFNQTKKIEAFVNSYSPKTITINKQSGFYAGLVFSPDISFVRFQKATGIGTSFGIIAGYKFNNKWSIETGLLSDKKKYYTKGNYFDKQNEAYLLDKELLYVDGNCKMIEIPVNARYTFLEQKKGKWTASVGISSYFLSKEFYRYALVENGQQEQSEHTYYHSDHHTTTVLNFGAGFEHSIGSTLQLRIEPYYKLPISSMGKGKLYLSSAGINVGIIKSFR